MTNVYVYGSCVSRDAFEHPHAPFMSGYSARSPMGSAFSPMLGRIPDIDLGMNPSAFQQAMVQTDLYKLLPSRLATIPFDILLIDLIDERLQMVRGIGGYYTYSPESQRCGMKVEKNDAVLPGSTEHSTSFRAGLERLLEVVPPNRILVNRVFWALVDVNGNKVASTENVARNNQILSELYAFLEEVDSVRFIDYPPELLVSDPDHKWGSSPFHYIPEFYEHTVEAIRSVVKAGNDEVESRIKGRGLDAADIGTEVAGRRLQSIRPIAFNDGRTIEAGGIAKTNHRIQTNGSLSYSYDSFVVNYIGDFGVHESTLHLPEPNAKSNGLSIRLRLTNWNDIRYLAVGHMHDGKYRHLKVVHLQQNEWLNISFSYDDLAYKVQNDFEPVLPCAISDIRIFIKGKPESDASLLEVAWCATWMENAASSSVVSTTLKPEDPHVQLLVNYVYETFVGIEEQVRSFLTTGRFPMPGGVELEWAIEDKLPHGLYDFETYRYIWHSLYFGANLVIYGRKYDDHAAVLAGQNLIQRWLEDNYWQESSDKRYAWYDHGSAERLIALLIVQHLGASLGHDYRFSRRLEAAIEGHSRLLEAESFYVANQTSRYHNHAWFQDLALISAAAITGNSRESKRRISKGLARLRDQFERLIVSEGEYAVFAENSSGYHTGIGSIVRLASAVEELATGSRDFKCIADKLDAWTEYFRYPNGSAPANGDTFSSSAPSLDLSSSPYKVPDFAVLPHSGYAVVKGNAEGSSYMMTFLATSVTATHKHCDDLSVTLFYDGIEWLIDPSYFSHAYLDDVPRYLRGPWAHNAVAIPGIDYSTAAGLSRLNGRIQGSHFSLSGEHEAYSGVVVQRVIEGSLEELRLSFRDLALSANSADPDPSPAYSVLHLGEGVMAEVEDSVVFLRHDASEHVLVVDFGEATARSVIGRGADDSTTSICGTVFGQFVDTQSILLQHPEPGAGLAWSIAVVR